MKKGKKKNCHARKTKDAMQDIAYMFVRRGRKEHFNLKWDHWKFFRRFKVFVERISLKIIFDFGSLFFYRI